MATVTATVFAVVTACALMFGLVWAVGNIARHPHDHDTPTLRCSICGASPTEETP